MCKINKISFDVVLNGKEYKDVTLEYPEEKDWCLDWENIHQEDNDSWCLVELDNKLVVDFQIYGDDDSKGMDAELRIQGNVMEKATDGDYYNHTNYWFGSYDTEFKNVKVYTDKGIKEIILN